MNKGWSLVNSKIVKWGFPGGSDSKASACNAGNLGSIPGSGRSPGEGNGNPLQYSCLENSMDGGGTLHGVTESQTWLSNFTSLHLVNSNVLELVSWFWQMYHGRAWVRAMWELGSLPTNLKLFHIPKVKALKTITSRNVTRILTVWITANRGKFLKRWEYQTTLPPSWEKETDFWTSEKKNEQLLIVLNTRWPSPRVFSLLRGLTVNDASQFHEAVCCC